VSREEEVVENTFLDPKRLDLYLVIPALKKIK
jgi:hypothetical protein